MEIVVAAVLRTVALLLGVAGIMWLTHYTITRYEKYSVRSLFLARLGAIIIMAIVTAEIGTRYIEHAEVSWRTPFAMIGFGLLIAGLWSYAAKDNDDVSEAD